MKVKISSLMICVSGLIAAPAFAHDSLSVCTEAVLKTKAGEIVKLEVKKEGKDVVYEYDVQSSNGQSWDIECLAESGKISEIEEEVKNSADPKFSKKIKVKESDARAIALKEKPGKITDVEYEIESDGAASYEFLVIGKDGKNYKIEVDATSGKISEVSQLLYQIGKE
jgi:uncharacterized membrane protein YkoI